VKIVPLHTPPIHPVSFDQRLKRSLLAGSSEPSPIVRCPANLRAFEDAGKLDEIHAHGWVGSTETWIDLYTWEPGTGDRYTLLYGRLSPSQYVLAWREYGTGDRWMLISEPGYIHHTYIEEKLDANQTDADQILKFLDRMGHAVGYSRRS